MSSNNTRHIILLFIAFLISFFLFKDIRYTDDFSTYESYYYQSVSDYGDLGYVFLENLGRRARLSFYEFYNCMIGLQLMAFLLMFRKYKVNEFPCLFCMIFLFYVQMANQIRYFLALPIFLIAINYLFVDKKYLVSIVLLALSFSIHNGIIGLILFVPLYFLITTKHYTQNEIIMMYLIIGIVFLCFYPLLYKNIVVSQNRFETYDESVSRLASLYYMVFPACSLYFIYMKYRKYNLQELEPEMKLVYYMSWFVIIWMIVSQSGIQIINARYVNAIFPMWLICMIYAYNKDPQKSIGSIVIFMVTALICKYLIPAFLFKTSDLDKILLIWSSKL